MVSVMAATSVAAMMTIPPLSEKTKVKNSKIKFFNGEDPPLF
jgi:hypothetical protein